MTAADTIRRYINQTGMQGASYPEAALAALGELEAALAARGIEPAPRVSLGGSRGPVGALEREAAKICVHEGVDVARCPACFARDALAAVSEETPSWEALDARQVSAIARAALAGSPPRPFHEHLDGEDIEIMALDANDDAPKDREGIEGVPEGIATATEPPGRDAAPPDVVSPQPGDASGEEESVAPSTRADSLEQAPGIECFDCGLTFTNERDAALHQRESAHRLMPGGGLTDWGRLAQLIRGHMQRPQADEALAICVRLQAPGVLPSEAAAVSEETR